ncbi:DapH/DapD/GlmU-related protein [Yoonia sp. SS1-5]|uniref:DapH/DapD/GlmU-related protein n=1 Tax=Yoonia rhodophyticola TaxID=3137370 RepID=A0AAN0M7T3_9RHOB
MKFLILPVAAFCVVIRKLRYSGFASQVRVQTARLLGARIGSNVKIRPGVLIKGAKNISIGNNCYIGEGTTLVGYDATITIGNDVAIAENVYISARNHRFRDPSRLIREQGYKGADVRVGDNVWLAHGATILAGTVLEPGTVVGAGAVAEKALGRPAIHTAATNIIHLDHEPKA